MNEFKLIVAGGRDFNNMLLMDTFIMKYVKSLPDDQSVSIVSGMAKGADRLAFEWAKAQNCKCYEMPADWNTHGRRAGFLRNNDMANVSQGLLAFHDGVSKGTQHMIAIARNKNLNVRVIQYDQSTGISTYVGEM
jgi:hypothetical protein